MRNLFMIMILAGIVTFCLSCEENEDALLNGGIYLKRATLRWKGDYSYDGCGFFIDIDGKTYKPENEEIIGNEFRVHEPISVILKFKILQQKVKYLCGDFYKTKEIEGIKIFSIQGMDK